jgi:predicted nucleic acid-binding protein
LRVAYVDSSCLIAIAFEEAGSRELMARLSRFDGLFSSALTEAEFRSALRRERRTAVVGNLLSWLAWVYPRRRLTAEMEQILEIGHSRGADLWHLSCALFLRPSLPDLRFLTLDGRQDEIARALNFPGL